MEAPAISTITSSQGLRTIRERRECEPIQEMHRLPESSEELTVQEGGKGEECAYNFTDVTKLPNVAR